MFELPKQRKHVTLTAHPHTHAALLECCDYTWCGAHASRLAAMTQNTADFALHQYHAIRPAAVCEQTAAQRHLVVCAGYSTA